MQDKTGLSHLNAKCQRIPVKSDTLIKVYSQSVPLRHSLILYRFSVSVSVKIVNSVV